MSKRVLYILAGVTLAGALATAGYWLLFTTFMVYDDEGYVLISLKNFAEHGALYDQVYSQYGPFFYVAYDALHHLFGFAWTNTAGRLITLVNWSATAGICGLLVWRFTRSASLTAFTGAGVFTYLWVMINEPLHPGGLLGLMVAATVWLGAEAIRCGRITAFAAIVGAIGTAAALIKINVGVFLLLAAVAWLLLHTPAAGRWARSALALLFVALPFVLMRTLFDAAWVRFFALIFSVSMLSVLIGARLDVPAVKWRPWLVFLVSGVLTAAVICGLTLIRGTSPMGLLAGVVLEPLNHPGVYFFAFNWRAGATPVLLAGFLVCLLYNRIGTGGRLRDVIAWIRVGLVGAALLSPLKLIPTSLAAFGMSYGVSAAGVLALPLRRNTASTVRLWLALVLVLQLLHAYPIAGSQINWGTFLWIPLLVLCAHEAIQVIEEHNALWHRFIGPTTKTGLAVAAVFMTGQLIKSGWVNEHYGEPLHLPGAQHIILPDDTAFALQIITENADKHADVLFSLPGTYSLNLWSRLPTPTLANATHWFSLLSPDQEQAIITRLGQSPHACIVLQKDTLKYIVAHGFHPRGKLAEYVGHEFEQAFEVDDYGFWVHRGRKIALLSTGQIYSVPASVGEQRLELVLGGPLGALGSVELWTMGAPIRIHRLTLTAANSSLEVTPLNETGIPSGDAHQLAWSAPLDSDAIIRLTATFHGDVGPPEKLVAFVLDTQGRRLASARVLH